jgi:hypothetical protein
MPKDPKKNVDRYKIAGGDLNEFEFQKNQAQVKESFRPGNVEEWFTPGKAPAKESIPGNKKEVKPVKRATAKNAAAKKAPPKKATVKGATAKKLAAKKAGKKK